MATKIGAVPRDLPVHHQNFLSAIKETVQGLVPSTLPPSLPKNVSPHPLPGAIQVQFTGGDNADGHLILVSDSSTWDPTKANNHIIDVGQSTMHVHNIGQPAVTRYYWVVARRGPIKTIPVGPVKATTLGLAVAAANSPYVPPAPNLSRNFTTNRATIPRVYRGLSHLP